MAPEKITEKKKNPMGNHQQFTLSVATSGFRPEVAAALIGKQPTIIFG